MYMGVLLGTILLAGCVADKTLNEQVVEDKNLPYSDKEETVSQLFLTQKQKAELYTQYQEIVEMVNAEYEATLELEPFQEFLSNNENWVKPEHFKQIAIDMAVWKDTTTVFGGESVD